MNIVNAKNLTKKFHDLTAVDHISFQVEKGDIYGFVGPNGAGKSTTINMLSGLLIPDNGTILFEDGATFDKWHASIGLVPQDLAIYPDLSAEENVSFFAALYGLKGKDLKQHVMDAFTTASVRLNKS